MRVTALSIAVTLGFALSFRAQAQEAPKDAQPLKTLSSAALRNAYAGGRDESDLTVQPHKRITKKEEELNPENFEPDAQEYQNGEGDAGFGE